MYYSIEYLSDDSDKLPVKFEAPRDGDVGYDLYASEDVVIKPGETVVVPTGLYLELPKDEWALILDRSGVSSKGVHRFAGVIDPDYRGEVKVVLHNNVSWSLLEDVSVHIGEMTGVHVNSSGGYTKAFMHELIEDHSYRIAKGDKIAQLVRLPVKVTKPRKKKSLSETPRGSDGFGSTDDNEEV
jgi:dUTP pyrophosphatase